MSRGGLRWGKYHVSVENCHSFSAGMRFYAAQRDDDDIEGDHREEDGYLVLSHKRDGAEYSERIQLTETRCHFGGSRRWLVCPGCGKRVGKVFLPTNLSCRGERVQRWLCRHCYRLTYEQRRSKDLSWVLGWRADRLLEKSRITATKRGYYRKPKGMRWKTFEKLTDKANALHTKGDACACMAFSRAFPAIFRPTGTGR
jgi:hypothetical protein